MGRKQKHSLRGGVCGNRYTLIHFNLEMKYSIILQGCFDINCQLKEKFNTLGNILTCFIFMSEKMDMILIFVC